MTNSDSKVPKPEFGSTSWGLARNGSMSTTERLRFTIEAILAQINVQGRSLLRSSVPAAERLARIDTSRIRLPDTSAVTQAAELARECVPDWVLRHSMRTWAWAVLFAQMDELKFDEEVLAVSCVLHDIALIPNAEGNDGGCTCCFAVAGGQKSFRYLLSLEWSEKKAALVQDAISLHMNINVGIDAGVEAHLLHEGAALDVVGARYREIDSLTRQVVLDRYSREGFKLNFSEAMHQQAQLSSNSRTAMLWTLGLKNAIERSPWSD